MRKDVAEKIRGSGRKLAEPPREPAPCDFANLVDGFLVHVLGLDTEEYRRAFWCEAYRNGHTIGHVPRTFNGFVKRNAHTPEEMVSLLLGVFVLFGAYSGTVFLLNWITRLVRVLRRPTYYEQERVRRRALADRRHRIVPRRMLNPRPSYDAIRAALAAARTSPEAALRCGSLMMDLACFADASLRFDDCGHIVSAYCSARRRTSSGSIPRSCATRLWPPASGRHAARKTRHPLTRSYPRPQRQEARMIPRRGTGTWRSLCHIRRGAMSRRGTMARGCRRSVRHVISRRRFWGSARVRSYRLRRRLRCGWTRTASPCRGAAPALTPSRNDAWLRMERERGEMRALRMPAS